MSSVRQQVMQRLKSEGWIHARTKGSHSIFRHRDKKSVISVPNDGKATNPRVFTAILCQLKNGTKFERMDLANKPKGATMETQQTSKPQTLSPQTKKLVLETMNQKAQEPKPPTLPFPAAVQTSAKAPVTAKGKPRGRTGAVPMKFSDEQILAAAATVEEGGTIMKAARQLRCSGPTAKKCLIKLFGAEAFNTLLNTPPKLRRKAAREREKLATKQTVSAPSSPAPSPEKPKFPVGTPPATPNMVDIPVRLPGSQQFSIGDITDVKFEASYGEAIVTLRLPVNSATFRLFCDWAPAKK